MMRSAWFGYALALGCLAVFLVLAWQVGGTGGPVWAIDRAVASAMQENAAEEPGILMAARHVTDAGGVPVMTALAVVGSLLLWLCRQQRLAAWWLLAAALGCVLNQGSKVLIDRPRPGAELRDEAVHERNASYPSGHAMGSTIGYGALACVGLVLLRRRTAKVAIVVVVALLVLVIGFSRVYLRAHWVSDVVGGFALGLAWLTACCLVWNRS